MLRIGITGGIGSGKTTACKCFAALGVAVYYSDVGAKELMNKNPKLMVQIKALFGEQAYDESGLNRGFVASKVFNNKELLTKLNAIVHPAVQRDFDSWANEHQGQGAKYVIEESAILFESEIYKRFDYCVTVSAPIEERIERIIARGGLSQQQIRERMDNQMSDAQREALADFTIDNREQNLLLPQVLKLHKIFTTQGDAK